MVHRRSSIDESEPRYEVADVSPSLLMFLAGGFAVSLGGVLLMVSLGFPAANRSYLRGPTAALPESPRLQTAPAADLGRYEGAKSCELQGRRCGKSREVRIPIEQAMRETAAHGWSNP